MCFYFTMCYRIVNVKFSNSAGMQCLLLCRWGKSADDRRGLRQIEGAAGDGDLLAGDAVGVGAVGQIYGHTAASVLQVEDAPNTASGPS